MFAILPLLAVAFAGGVWLATAVSVAAGVLGALAAGLLLVALAQVRRGARTVAVTAAALFFVAGMLRYGGAEVISPYDVSRFAGRTVTLHGAVDGLPRWADVDHETVIVRYVVAAAAVDVGQGGLEPVAGKVVVSFRQPRRAAVAAYGDRVSVRGRVDILRGYNNPGQADVAAVYRLEGVTARMTARAGDFRAAPGGDSSPMAMVAGWRQMMTEFIRATVAADDAAVISGVLFGGYAGIKREVVRDFAATGLVHILSVSGAHIALVAGAVLWAGARLGLRRAKTAGLAAAAVIVYALLAGLTPPVLRSAVMGLAALAAVVLGRDRDTLQALALAALGMLAWQPALLFDISFQLSFGAALGLVLLYPPTAAALSFLPPWLAGPLAATAAAQLGVVPLLLWYFSSLPPASFVANIVILPVIEAVVVAGLLAVLAAPLLPLVGKLLLVFCAQLVGVAVKLAAWLSAVPGATLHFPAMGVAAGTAYYFVLAWAYGLLPRLPGPAAIVRRWPRRAAAVLALFIVVYFGYANYPRPLAVHFIDVGQGDATLIVTPHRRAVLIDAGGGREFGGFDVGERVVVPYLRHYGVTALDYLVLTHGHQDHAGGAAAVVAALPVRTVLVPQDEPAAPVRAVLRVTGGRGVVPAYAGQSILLDDVSIRVVQAPGEGRVGRGEESTVVLVEYGRHRFLVTGDLGGREEHMLAGRVPGAGGVLKVSHHGARSATTPELLAAFQPDYAVISAGHANRFGHPHPEALQRLAARGVAVYRTDRDGAVVFRSDGRELTVETCRGGQ
ncbi:DNA internalization-related competence protein ComEC/Rec2 [Anaeroselena agilis]|uniref:DNA internalization-related competence protein ComEC/Rec2 n=1 Tax=Anaeroselena agilis TaxID=3063788 RepID=A0ABU3NYV3_9FIRM|nr:DNA internalization-related competence protein ComEC/Rec2 [Selenomonadales bacterium 4137-cl]